MASSLAVADLEKEKKRDLSQPNLKNNMRLVFVMPKSPVRPATLLPDKDSSRGDSGARVPNWKTLFGGRETDGRGNPLSRT